MPSSSADSAAAPAVEARLLAAARAGDGEAFAALVRPHLDALGAFARRAGPDPEAAADIVQDSLLRAWRGLAAFRGDCPFRTWLFAITWRVGRTEWARRARLPQAAAIMPEIASDASGPEARAVLGDFVRRAAAALHRLPPGQRAAIAQVDFGGRPLAAAASSLGVPLGTLKTHLHRGRKRLAALLQAGSDGAGRS